MGRARGAEQGSARRGRARQLLERRWFHGRRCLDIGCNEGLVTLAVAGRFGTASMLGVDLDAHLIRNACRRARIKRHWQWQCSGWRAEQRRCAVLRVPECMCHARDRTMCNRALQEACMRNGECLGREGLGGRMVVVMAASASAAFDAWQASLRGRHLREERTQAAARAGALARPGASRAAAEGEAAVAGGPAQRRAAAASARALKATHFLLGDFLDLVGPRPSLGSFPEPSERKECRALLNLGC